MIKGLCKEGVLNEAENLLINVFVHYRNNEIPSNNERLFLWGVDSTTAEMSTTYLLIKETMRF